MKQWTIMVYMAGDNNLSEDMVTGLIGMKKNLEATFNANVAFLAYYDTGALAFPTVRCDFTKNGDEPAKAARSTGSPFVEPDWNEKTSADSIYGFVKWCIEQRKHEAENYALIFSGHGDGFQPATFLSDENPVSNLTVPGLCKILKKIERDFLGGKKLGVIGFDSCVMGTLEVAYELSDVAELMVASQGLVPNNGWNYCTIADEISAASERGEALDKETLAGIFARSFVRAYWDYAFYSARSVDVGVCDLSRVKRLGESVCKLGERLTETLKSCSPAAKKIEQAILQSHWRAQTHVFDQCIDVLDFCENLQAECEALRKEAEGMTKVINASENADGILKYLKDLSETAAKISGACDKVTEESARCIKQSFSLGAEFQYSNGLSLYFPWSYVSYLISKGQYMKRDFAAVSKKKDAKKSLEPSGWTRFLDCYLAKTMRPPRASSDREFFLFDLPEKTLGEKEKEIFRLNYSYDDKLNLPYNKLNLPYNKLNYPNDKLLTHALGDFARTKNSPWAPTLWQPAENLFEPEEETSE